jgi:GNAT superfamily N-acetyltransferase
MTEWHVREASLDDVVGIIEVFHLSRRAAMPWLPVLHTAEEDLAFFRSQVDRGSGWVVAGDDALLGFAICSPGWLDHLYVRPEERGRGVGSALLQKAKRDQPDGIDLWVFQRNAPARTFYAERGFVEVSLTNGATNEEREPDALMHWPGA